MGASVYAYWPGITEDQMEDQPGFYNDDKAWGDWMAEREEDPRVRQVIMDLGAGAILTHLTDGMDEADVLWVAPEELADAARKLRGAVEARLPEAEPILESYAENANGIDPPEEEFAKDLEDVEGLARWAGELGAPRMTLHVSW